MARTRALLILILLCWAPVSVPAQTLGMLDASAFEGVPAEAEMRVQPMANSPLDRDLKAVFQTALRNAGYRLSEQGGHSFAYRVTGAVERQNRQSQLQLEGQGGSQDAEDLSLTLRWRVGKDGERRDARERLLLIRLSDPAGHVVWEARMVFLSAVSDLYEAVGKVAPGIVDEIGRDVIGRQLP